MSVESDPTFWRWVAGVAVSGAAALWGGFKYLDARFEKKADKSAVADMKTESERHRDYIAKLFDKLDQHSQRDEELAREIIGTMSSNHAELLRELGRKADR